MADGFLIGGDLLGRIRRTVDGAESTAYRMNVPGIPVRFEGEDGGGGSRVRVGKIADAWAVGTCATVTLWERIGSECALGVTHDPTQTIENVANLSHDVPAGAWVVVGQAADGKWYLLEAGPPIGDPPTCRQTIGGEDITTWPGWNGTKVQLLGHDENGCLKWFDSEECETSPGAP